jgi:hypothetical protein
MTLLSRNEVVHHLSNIEDMSAHSSVMIPMQVLADIDNSRNPMQLTKDRLERAATENQFMNGKIAAVSVRTSLVNTTSVTCLLLLRHTRAFSTMPCARAFPLFRLT